jgi:hypothetical protein
MPVAAMGFLSLVMPTFAGSVSLIVAIGSEEKMLRIETRWVIALV